MTKEEIIDNIIYRQTDGEEYACLKKEDCMNAMQDYADQETERLKAELAEYKERYECNQHTVINQQGTINDLKVELSEKDAEIERLEQEKIMLERYCSKYESELSELKERHKRDVMEAFGDGWEKGIARPKLMCVNLEQYYKQKFEK